MAGSSNLVKPFEVYNRALQREIQQLVQRFEYRRTVEHAVERLPRAELGLIVDEMLERLPAWDTASENLRMAREKALERAVVNLVRALSSSRGTYGADPTIPRHRRSPHSSMRRGSTTRPICSSIMTCSMCSSSATRGNCSKRLWCRWP